MVHIFLVEELSSGKKVQSPVITGYGDCRTCTLLTLGICDYDWCPKQDPDSEEVTKPCCWKCENLISCIEELVASVGVDLIEDLFGVSYEEFIEAVKRMRKRLIGEQ